MGKNAKEYFPVPTVLVDEDSAHGRVAEMLNRVKELAHSVRIVLRTKSHAPGHGDQDLQGMVRLAVQSHWQKERLLSEQLLASATSLARHDPQRQELLTNVTLLLQMNQEDVTPPVPQYHECKWFEHKWPEHPACWKSPFAEPLFGYQMTRALLQLGGYEEANNQYIFQHNNVRGTCLNVGSDTDASDLRGKRGCTNADYTDRHATSNELLPVDLIMDVSSLPWSLADSTYDTVILGDILVSTRFWL